MPDRRAARIAAKKLKRLAKRRAQYANKRAGRTWNGDGVSPPTLHTTKPVK